MRFVVALAVMAASVAPISTSIASEKIGKISPEERAILRELIEKCSEIGSAPISEITTYAALCDKYSQRWENSPYGDRRDAIAANIGFIQISVAKMNVNL